MPVNTCNAAYDAEKGKWCKMRDVVEGHDAIQRGGERYLPKLTDQTDEEYKAYKERATFFNATGRVVDTMSGIIFRKDATLDKADGLTDILDDVTLTGVPVNQFCENIVKEVLEVNRVGVLVDFPAVGENRPITAMQAAATGFRVFARTYRAEDIINWRTMTVGGKVVLSLVVLRELKETINPKDPFCVICSTIYRVLEMVGGQYVQSVWEEAAVKGAKTALQLTAKFTPTRNGKPLSDIPFEFFSATGSEPTIKQPVLYDLAVVNIAHYRNDADREHGLHYTGLPTAVVSGVDTDETDTYRIGSSTAWMFSNPNAKAAYLEFKGEGLGALRTAQQDKEAQMAALGARMLAPEKKDAEAADTIAQKRQGETSMLAALANSVSRGMTKILRTMAEWQGVGSGQVTITLNTDYTTTRMLPTEITALLEAVMSGTLSKESFYEALVEGEAISGNRTYEEEQAKIEADGVIPAPVPNAGTTPNANAQ